MLTIAEKCPWCGCDYIMMDDTVKRWVCPECEIRGMVDSKGKLWFENPLPSSDEWRRQQ